MRKPFIKQLAEKGLPKGSRLEIILFGGVEFGNFGTRADDPKGYEPRERMTQETGEKIMGYLWETDEDGSRVYLTVAYNNGARTKARILFYIEEPCIYDARYLTATPNPQMPCLPTKVPGSEGTEEDHF